MTDDRRRRDDERLRRAQEIANTLREQQVELASALRGSAHRARTEPVVLAEWRSAHASVTWSRPDDIG